MPADRALKVLFLFITSAATLSPPNVEVSPSGEVDPSLPIGTPYDSRFGARAHAQGVAEQYVTLAINFSLSVEEREGRVDVARLARGGEPVKLIRTGLSELLLARERDTSGAGAGPVGSAPPWSIEWPVDQLGPSRPLRSVWLQQVRRLGRTSPPLLRLPRSALSLRACPARLCGAFLRTLFRYRRRMRSPWR